MKKFYFLLFAIMFLSPWITYLSSHNMVLTGLYTQPDAVTFTHWIQFIGLLAGGFIYAFKEEMK